MPIRFRRLRPLALVLLGAAACLAVLAHLHRVPVADPSDDADDA